MTRSNAPDAGAATEPDAAAPGMTRGMTAVFAFACGALVANIYYAQGLVGLIAPQLGLSGGAAGLVVTLTQLGYGSGLFLIVSLSDLVENRRLVLIMVTGAACGLVGLACARNAAGFLAFAYMTGFCSVGAQVLVPLAAHLSPPETRGRTVGNIMGGLVVGIMLARPVANMVAASFGWRAMFWIAAAAMGALLLWLSRTVPHRQPSPSLHYGQILLSSLEQLVFTPIVRRRTAYQALLFCAFNVFWTAAPLVLAQRFGLGPRGIAVFALAGAAGALTAPIAGRLADRGLTRIGTAVALMLACAAFLISGWGVAAGLLVLLTLAAVLLDAAIQLNQVLSQHAIYAMAPAARGRVNAVFGTSIMLSGAVGSLLASVTFYRGGWALTAETGVALAAAALLLFFTEFLSPAPAGDAAA